MTIARAGMDFLPFAAQLILLGDGAAVRPGKYLAVPILAYPPVAVGFQYAGWLPTAFVKAQLVLLLCPAEAMVSLARRRVATPLRPSLVAAL